MNPVFVERGEGDGDFVHPAADIVPNGIAGVDRGFFAYSIDKTERRVWVKFKGRLTFDVIATYAGHLAANGQFEPSYGELVDLRLIQTVALTAEELIQLADKVDPFELNSKRAFVAQCEDQIRAARLHQLLRPGSENMRIFISLGEAQQWLCCE